MYDEDEGVEKEDDFKMGDEEDLDNPEVISDLLDLDEEDPDRDH
jgi:hypothetical protein